MYEHPGTQVNDNSMAKDGAYALVNNSDKPKNHKSGNIYVLNNMITEHVIKQNLADAPKSTPTGLTLKYIGDYGDYDIDDFNKNNFEQHLSHNLFNYLMDMVRRNPKNISTDKTCWYETSMWFFTLGFVLILTGIIFLINGRESRVVVIMGLCVTGAGLLSMALSFRLAMIACKKNVKSATHREIQIQTAIDKWNREHSASTGVVVSCGPFASYIRIVKQVDREKFIAKAKN